MPPPWRLPSNLGLVYARTLAETEKTQMHEAVDIGIAVGPRITRRGR